MKPMVGLKERRLTKNEDVDDAQQKFGLIYFTIFHFENELNMSGIFAFVDTVFKYFVVRSIITEMSFFFKC